MAKYTVEETKKILIKHIKKMDSKSNLINLLSHSICFVDLNCEENKE